MTNSNPIAVVKFGSSILPSIEEISRAINEVYQYIRNNYRVLVVVSAIGETTDNLVNTVKKILDDSDALPPSQEFADLLATGESAAAALFSIALDRAGIKSKKCDHHFIKTIGSTLNADPIHLKTDQILALFEQYPVLVIPGFIGSDEQSNTTLLGRGGSDFTAIFAGHLLNASECVIYKDTDGIFEHDPKISEKAKRYEYISYKDSLKITSGVIQHKAIKFAQQHLYRFTVKSLDSMSETIVSNEKSCFAIQKQNNKKLKIILLGLGTVGFGVYKHILAHKQQFELTGIAVQNLKKHEHQQIPAHLISDDLQNILSRECDVVIELMGGVECPSELVSQFLSRKCHVITANKALIAEKGVFLSKLASHNDVILSYSASVAGSIPVLERLRQLSNKKESHRIKSITGIVNGTCNFVLDKMYEGACFADAVTLAQKMGFAEQNPHLDLSGIDAAQKMTIISRIAFGKDPDVLEVQGIQTIDQNFIKNEKDKGYKVKLIAECYHKDGEVIVHVKPISLKLSHPLAQINDVHNAILIQTDTGDIIPLEGKGAGCWPTAESVFSDLLNLSRQINDQEILKNPLRKTQKLGGTAYESLDTIN